MEPKKAKPAVNKTQRNDADVKTFILSSTEGQKQADALQILDMMGRLSGEKPEMWGETIIGFGRIKVVSPGTGREVDWFRIGFAPRKANFSLYMSGNIQKHAALLEKLGKHKTGLGCLYLNKLSDVDLKVLESIMKATLKADNFGI